ncbi:MAG: ATP-binding cassette domain-containing protein [Bacteroidota bacterium]
MSLLSVYDGGRSVGGRWVWRALDLRLGAGERLAVVGPSGSGKTLLLRALAGLDRLDEGEVRWEGRVPEADGLPAHRARVGYLSQTPALFAGTVADNLRAPFDLGVHAGRAYDPEAACRALDRLGRRAAFLDQGVDGLSGGERQLAQLLRAMQAAPQVLLLDEPTASLDTAATAEVEALVADYLAAEAGRAAVWTSHDPAQLDRATDRRLNLAAFAP